MIRTYTLEKTQLRQINMEDASIQTNLRRRWVWVDAVEEEDSKIKGLFQSIADSHGLGDDSACWQFEIHLLDETESFVRVYSCSSAVATLMSEDKHSIVTHIIRTCDRLKTQITPELILSRLLQEIAHDNETHLEKIRVAVADLEDEAVEQKSVIERVQRIKRLLRRAHAILQRQHEFFIQALEGEIINAGEDNVPKDYLSMGEAMLEREMDALDRYQRDLSEIIGLSNLAASMHMNRVMTWLTVIATVLLLPNTVGTIAGIPSLPIPESAWPTIAGILLLSALAPWWYARSKGWLKR